METSKYQLVDSLYGPGTVGAWLLTLSAVLISWTLNKSTRRKDTISIDLIGAVLLPMISAGHLVFQVYNLPYSITETITSSDVEVQKYASALEAPLNICETFSMVSLLAAACCGPWWGCVPKLRRLGVVLLAGSLSWGAENVMFATATLKGVKADDTKLSRPYLFFITPIVAASWGFLVICLFVGGAFWLIGKSTLAKVVGSDVDLEGTKPFWSLGCHSTDHGPAGDDVSMSRFEMAKLSGGSPKAWRQANRVMMAVSLLSVLFSPGSFVTSLISISMSTLGAKEASAEGTHRLLMFIPASNGSMNNLDQILAFVGGVLVLLWSIRAVYTSRENSTENVRRRLLRRRSI
ncbi:hypothetical protein GLAREA_10084 [Glarea lozoyensis ATCC 20868]|uniref:Uncharacterized protein n=1 Tax=Glarea lozoyensis (strain ATCC 20868 / MF5171) TaxID=1116229 RepID=S3D9I5_GLAL2|nr:uncharacterized protein GLAREA_10084 [Glarea lozoyensis ATCC 20868]EPE34390.1 hypothetical protein GLAREA_10084 [Glarea lozoyensis ATCC 20868]